jgi:anti-anti-sigma regulatory factor
MTTLQVDPELIVQTLQEGAREQLPGAAGELVLDFSSVAKIDAATARALEDLADLADRSSVKVALRSVHVGVYRTLKLLKLASKFSFLE